jgi:hypothetical protein
LYYGATLTAPAPTKKMQERVAFGMMMMTLWREG